MATIKTGEHLSISTEFKKGAVPHNKGTAKIGNCLVCGKEIPIKRKYCSFECRGKDPAWKNKISKTKTGVANPTAKKINNLGVGKNNINWKGGISKVDKMCRRLPAYIEWRNLVFARDNWTCQICGGNKYVTAHHIIGFSKILKDNNITNTSEAIDCDILWDISNGKTLCEKCHKETDNYRGRGRNKR